MLRGITQTSMASPNLRVTVFERSGPLGGWRERARLLAPRSGHFEVAARERDPQVTKDHVTVE